MHPDNGFLILCLPGIARFVALSEKLAEQKAADAGGDVSPALFLQESMHEILRTIEGFKQLRDLAQPPIKKVPPSSEPITLQLGPLISGARSGLDKKYQDEHLPRLPRVSVYVVRNGEEVLYVGATKKGARTRLRAHVSARSRLGSAIRHDKGSRDWTVEVIPFPDYRNVLWKERELINQLNPKYCGPPTGDERR